MITKIRLSTALMLFSVLGAARAAECERSIEANDLMQFDQRQLSVPSDCTSVTITLRHAGSEPIVVMGHDWVLAKTADVAALAEAGQRAGLTHNFQPSNDPRIIAATRVVGGGESATVRFSTADLLPGGDYTFFCTYPGHFGFMRGAFVFGASPGVARLKR